MVQTKILRLLSYIAKFLMACWFGLVVAGTLIILYPALAITHRVKGLHTYAHMLRRFWMKWNLFWGGVRLECVFEESLDANKAYVFTPNHTSKLDMMVLLAGLGVDFVYVGKKEFKDIPIFGVFFRTIDIPLDTKNPVKAYKLAMSELQQGKNIAIFPEGTIARITPKLSPFKDGGFRMAIAQQADIVPITLIGNWELLPDDGPFHFKPGKLIMHIHKPISTHGLTAKDTQKVSEIAFNTIQTRLKEAGY